MTQKAAGVRPKLARGVALLCPVGVAAALWFGCTELRGSLGDDCLKADDCLSGVCAQFVCVAAPPLLDTGTPTGTPAPAADASSGTDAASDAGAAGDAADAADAGMMTMTAGDASGVDDGAPGDGAATDDGPGVTVPDDSSVTPDAPVDGLDARADAGEAG